MRGEASSAMGAPVLRLRSKRGKLLLLISRRMACPARKRFLVTQQSMTNSYDLARASGARPGRGRCGSGRG